MNIPNMISIFRIILVPVFILAFNYGMGKGTVLYAILVFILSGISDILDGYIAKNYNMMTDLGAVLDPLADKLMLITALICFTYSKHIPLWIVIIVSIKELLMIVGGFLSWRQGIVTKSNVYGKIATMLFHVSIVTFLFSDKIAYIFLIVSIAASLVAFYNYMCLTLKKHRAKKKLESSGI